METIVISLGGSMIAPEEVDVNFLKEFRNLILNEVKNGRKFILVTGGGKICRKYQQAAKEIVSPGSEDLDWIGIMALRLNAELVRVIFGELASPKVVQNLSEKFVFDKPILIGSAYRPGQSTDWDAVLAAKNVGAKKIINLSNTDYVYDSDPNKNPNAKKFEKLSWSEFRALIPKDWQPGLSSPFDPIASEMAEREGMEVIIMNGKPVQNIQNCLENKAFFGTTIK